MLQCFAVKLNAKKRSQYDELLIALEDYSNAREVEIPASVRSSLAL